MSTDDKKAFFLVKQNFMFAIFQCLLQTDQETAFVHHDETDFDAQKMYASLEEYSLKFAKSALETSKLLSYITSAWLANGSWKGSPHNFILHLWDKVCLYE